MSFTLAMFILGFAPVNPLIGLSVFSISLLFGSASLSILLPILVSQEGLGTAVGLCTSAFHVSLGLQDLVLGLLQSQNYSRKSQVYGSTMLFLVVAGLVATIFSLLTFVLDYLYDDSKLNSSINAREKLLLAQARSPTSIGPSARFYTRTKRGNQIAISLLCLAGLSYFMLFFSSL
ncbi:hypothetical protein DSO57_1023626 [Entomophthora muscae]|uniref:Uncharacterized protein n=1 Tax=Entomophthora muscae TaxID=34485 RepID=A0ACC2UP11_9FUNG|nr:hypothetical protein DSO57_1023626 [Entomophthora muscae]